MENEENVVPETTEEVTPEVTPEETPEEETVEELRERLTKAEEAKKKSDDLANNYKIRAEKAEKGIKKPVTEEKKTGDLSSKDIFAIMNAKVAEEDIDEVVDYAKFKGISVGEALKTSTIKATLSERDEQRKTAMATNTGAARRGSSSASVESLLDNAVKGTLPESDKDIERLMQAKLKQGRK